MGGFIFGSGGGGNGGPDLSLVTMEPQFGLKDKMFYDRNGNLVPGTILNWDGTVLFTPSTDGNKMVVTPRADTAQHIAGGKYLGRDIEFAAMPAGSAVLERNDNVVTLRKTAGYIPSGPDETETVPAYTGVTSMTPGASAKTFSVADKYCGSDLTVEGDSDLKATNIKNGVTIFGITGTYSGSSYATYSGATTITPSTSAQYFYTNGYYVDSNLKVNGSSYLKAANIKKGVTIFGVTGTYEASAVAPSTRSTTASRVSATQLRVYYSSANTIYSVGFIGTISNGTVLAGIARYGLSTCRGVFIDSNGSAQVGNNNLTAEWTYENQVDFTVTGYTFNTGTYTVYICYD